MDKRKFIQIIDEGIDRNKEFMVVKIETEGNPAPEIIINSSSNFKAKIAYYAKAYDDHMELIRAKEAGKVVKIIDVLMTSNLNDLAWFGY